MVHATHSHMHGELQEHIDLAKADFPAVFKDIMDLDHFERNMFFSDPISRFTFFRGVHRFLGPPMPFKTTWRRPQSVLDFLLGQHCLLCTCTLYCQQY